MNEEKKEQNKLLEKLAIMLCLGIVFGVLLQSNVLTSREQTMYISINIKSNGNTQIFSASEIFNSPSYAIKFCDDFKGTLLIHSVGNELYECQIGDMRVIQK